MLKRCIKLLCFLLAAVPTAHAGGPKGHGQSDGWNRFTAATYLDARQQWWMDWPDAQRDHETACVSCHTALPYALGRYSLHHGPMNTALSPQEARMIGYIARRVTLWKEVEPFYTTEERGPRKSEESRGSEAVMNALILVRYDKDNSHLREITREALGDMWALQVHSGAEAGSWDWINFHNGPWESDESHYWGTTLAAVTIGWTPESYRNTPAVRAGVAAMRDYLVRNYEKQPLVNRINVLWASGRMPGLLTPAQRNGLLADISAHQQADGGWTTATLGPWKRRDHTALDTASDGYATGLIVYALREAGVPASNSVVQRGRQWLMANQNADGHWNAASLNKQRKPAADAYLFMSDAATAYAALALSSFSKR